MDNRSSDKEKTQIKTKKESIKTVFL